jgi:hypothetical protein
VGRDGKAADRSPGAGQAPEREARPQRYQGTALREIEEVQRDTNEYVASVDFAEDVKQEVLLEQLESDDDADQEDDADGASRGIAATNGQVTTVEERLLKAETIVSGLHIVNELVDGMESGTYKEWQLETHKETKALVVKTNSQHPFARSWWTCVLGWCTRPPRRSASTWRSAG